MTDRYGIARVVAELGFTDGDEDTIANAVLDHLRRLPVEQRMEAVGMRPWVRYPNETPVWIEEPNV